MLRRYTFSRGYLCRNLFRDSSTVCPKLKREFSMSQISNLRHKKENIDTKDLNRVNSRLNEQLLALEKMTKEVKMEIQKKKEEKQKVDLSNELGHKGSDEATEKDIDEVFDALGISSQEQTVEEKLQIGDSSMADSPSSRLDLNNCDDLMTLFPSPKPYVSLPGSITKILTTEQISNITQRETARWEPVIDAILQSSVCDPLSETLVDEPFTGFDFHKLVSVIPRKDKIPIVEKLHELALTSGVLWGDVRVLNDLLALCNLLPKGKAKTIVDLLLKDVDLGEQNDKKETANVTTRDEPIKANITTKSILLNHYARLGDVVSVRKYVSELNQLPKDKNPMMNSPIIYTSIMQMYIRLDNYELAKQTFDTMKFLSLSTSPSPHTYTSMILLDTLHNNIEHGISVHEEMQEKDIKPEPEALLALAKGCGARRGLVSQGWNYIIQYYENGYPVDSQVMEIMMYLAYVDGDLPFVRGIWMNICETNTKLAGNIQLPHPRATKWLFNAYYKVGDIMDAAKGGKTHTPVGIVDSRVRAIRTKVLELTSFDFHSNSPPLLPLIDFDGSNTKLMLSEAHAIWRYILDLDVKGSYISESLVEAYLYIVGRYGLLETFESEWNRLTYFDTSSLQREVINIEEPDGSDAVDIENETDRNNTSTTSVNPIESAFSHLPMGKLPRNDRFYNMAMHVARHQASLAFAQKIWTERGSFRKSESFQRLTPAQQDVADFKFARLMLSALTHTGNVGDAYKLVLSSQNRFVWSKYHLKSLLSLCERLGYTSFAKELLKVVRRGAKWTRRQEKLEE